LQHAESLSPQAFASNDSFKPDLKKIGWLLARNLFTFPFL
jgi:hypothetical protein